MAQLGSTNVLGNLSVTKKLRAKTLDIDDSVIYLGSEEIMAPDCNGVFRKAQTIATINDSSMEIVSGIPDVSSVTFSKIGTGHYRISNISAFASGDWGVALPRDDYDIPQLVVDTAAGGGDLNIYVYEPVLKIGTPTITKGNSINIPSGSSISVNILV